MGLPVLAVDWEKKKSKKSPADPRVGESSGDGGSFLHSKRGSCNPNPIEETPSPPWSCGLGTSHRRGPKKKVYTIHGHLDRRGRSILWSGVTEEYAWRRGYGDLYLKLSERRINSRAGVVKKKRKKKVGRLHLHQNTEGQKRDSINGTLPAVRFEFHGAQRCTKRGAGEASEERAREET